MSSLATRGRVRRLYRFRPAGISHLRNSRQESPGQAVGRASVPLSLPFAALAAAIGLGIQEGAYQLSLRTASGLVQPLFFLGLLLEVVPFVFVIAHRHQRKWTRLTGALLMSEFLFLSRWLVLPRVFGTYDALLHTTSLWQLVDGQRFLSENTLLPVSSYYPGLELVTAGVHWLTGLNLLGSQLIVLMGARALLVTALFLLFERLTRSTQAAGAAIALYAVNPEFYAFDAQFAYETLALMLAAVAAFYLSGIFRAESYVPDVPLPDPSPRWSSWPSAARGWLTPRGRGAAACAVIGLMFLDVTHHVTSWATLGALILLFVWRKLSTRGVQWPVPDPSVDRATRLLGLIVLLDVVFVGAWTTFVGHRITGYLGPLARQAASSISSILLGHQQTKGLFAPPAGAGTPEWQRWIILGSVVLWVALIAATAFSRAGRETRRVSPILWPLLVANLGYFAINAARLSPSATEIGNRAGALVFGAVACTLGAWWAASRWHATRRAVAVSLVAFALLSIGGVTLGTGANYTRVPGAYLVEADQRSVPGPSLDFAHWVRQHVPTGTRVGADRDNAAVLGAFGHLTPVTEFSGSVNVGPLFFADSIGGQERALVKKGDIRLLVVDQRLTQGLPFAGFYFEPGETYDPATKQSRHVRLTTQELDKFASWPQAHLIHRSGPISLYDLSSVQGLPPVSVSVAAAPRDSLSRFHWPTLGAFGVFLALLAATTRRRRVSDVAGPDGRDPAALTVGFAIVLSCALIAAVIVATQVNPPYLVIPLYVLALVAVKAVRPWRWSAPRAAITLRLADVTGSAAALIVTGAAISAAIIFR
jgi:hypothetical protein